MPRQLEHRPLDQLRPAERNAKSHDEALIGRSIGRHGYVELIVEDGRTGRVISGHGRLAELRRLEAAGAEPPDGVDVDADGTWLVPIVTGWSSKDDADADETAIVLNRTGEVGGWAPDVLADVLGELAELGRPLEEFGWSADQLDDLVGPVELPPGGTDAEHAALPERGDPQQPREVQGLREVGLMFQDAHWREYQEHLATLKRAWSIDAAPVVVLRALAESADRARAAASA